MPETIQRLGFPNYGLSVSTVYQRTTIALLFHETRSIEIPMTARGSRSGTLSLPTWCLDFTVPDWLQDVTEQYPYGNAACRFLKPTPLAHDELQGLLMLDCVQIGHIDMTLRLPSIVSDLETFCSPGATKRKSLDQILRGCVQALTQFRKRALDCLEQRVGTKSASRIFASGDFWKTLAGGWELRVWSWHPEDPVLCLHLGWANARERHDVQNHNLHGVAIEYINYARLERSFVGAFPSADGAMVSSTADYVPHLSDFDHRALISFIATLEDTNAMLFCTDNGYFGRAPIKAKRGDHVVIPSRERYPVVVRPTAVGTYEHVAYAYVQGCMAGEFVEDLEKVERRQLWLR